MYANDGIQVASRCKIEADEAVDTKEDRRGKNSVDERAAFNATVHPRKATRWAKWVLNPQITTQHHR
jgi:hypothetical protein